MKPERWERVKEVLDAALELPAGERTAFLDKTCGADAELRKEVESLLAASEDSDSFLEKSPVADLPADAEDPKLEGRVVFHYRILEEVGRGGMGIVYRAMDTKLDRPVALKVLPDAFAQDKDRLQRFEREARVLASLNHPNIATIHEIGHLGEVPFLVLELVPGETLADALAKSDRLPLEEALPLFKQIAEAMEAAHDRKIIHRDLKPANIKITPDGKVKVLDFGLAKAFEEDAAAGTPTSAITGIQGTRSGIILGTATYMSPEQARGKRVDQRTDIWAFGCCIYETLVGEPLFHGATISDTIAQILSNEPDWEALPETTPESIRRVLRRCLNKNPQRRFRDAWDIRVELEEALNEPAWAPKERLPRRLRSRSVFCLGRGRSTWSRRRRRRPLELDGSHSHIIRSGHETDSLHAAASENRASHCDLPGRYTPRVHRRGREGDQAFRSLHGSARCPTD